MARYEQRQLLEQLIGRDVLINPSRHSRDYGIQDPKVCKLFLMGVCPYELFMGTKQEIGKCNKIHLEKHKLQYEKEVREGKEFPEFMSEAIGVLNRYIVDCNRKIDVSLKRLEPAPEEKTKISEAARDLEVIEARINIMERELEKLVEAGEITKGIEHGVRLQETNVKRDFYIKRLRDVTENAGQSQQQKLQVCEVCGAYLSRLDSDRRLSDHYLGKLHLAYVQMRSVLADLKRARR